MTADERPLYGLLAELPDIDTLLEACRGLRERGYAAFEAYSPFPVEGLREAVGYSRTRLPVLVFIGGLTGTLTGFGLQYYTSVIGYPYNVGGRPTASWPSFVIIGFELTILFAGLTALIGMLALNRLPQPYHPLFNVDRFALASQTAFFIAVECRDPHFSPEGTRTDLEELGATEVWNVVR